MKLIKKFDCILVLSLALFCTACSKKSSVSALKVKNDEPTLIDLNKEYPKLSLNWQDIASVEYIPLETKDDVLIDSYNDIIITDTTIIVCNKKNGDFFTFDRKGKFISKFNHKGGSGEEYSNIFKVTYDEISREISIYDIFKGQIIAYSPDGNFMRSIRVQKKGSLNALNSFNKDLYLACYSNFPVNGGPVRNHYRFISKTDGSIVDTILSPISKYVPENFYADDGSMLTFSFTQPIIRIKDGFILADISSDTIYSISDDRKLKPIFIRTPSLSETSYPIVLNAYLKTDNYFFFCKTDYDYEATTIKEIQEKVKKVEGQYYVLDLKTNKLYIDDIHNADYPESNTSAQGFSFNEVNNNQYVHEYLSYKLVKALEEGKLSGQLKDIASGIKEDDNPVLMIIKFKSDAN
jgi:hypothetical protein